MYYVYRIRKPNDNEKIGESYSFVNGEMWIKEFVGGGYPYDESFMQKMVTAYNFGKDINYIRYYYTKE